MIGFFSVMYANMALTALISKNLLFLSKTTQLHWEKVEIDFWNVLKPTKPSQNLNCSNQNNAEAYSGT